jgi:DNA-binding transcriptional LysR family regulator
MELRHLRYVVAVADCLHFGQAAEQLHISQPPLSQQIRQLEDELGVTLFDRTNRQVRLTKAGQIFVEEARLVLAQADHCARVAMRVNDGEVGQLTIGVAGPSDIQIFADILRLFARRHPNIRIVARSMATAEQAQALREGRLHVGLVVAPVEDPALAADVVMPQSIMVALPRGHPLAARAQVPLRALAAEPHVMLARDLDPRFFDAIVGACRRSGFTLHVAHEVDHLHTACALVAAGLGVAFVPAGLQDSIPRSIVLRTFRPALPHVDSQLAIAYRREPLCDLVQRFVTVAREIGSMHVEKNKEGGRPSGAGPVRRRPSRRAPKPTAAPAAAIHSASSHR